MLSNTLFDFVIFRIIILYLFNYMYLTLILVFLFVSSYVLCNLLVKHFGQRLLLLNVL